MRVLQGGDDLQMIKRGIMEVADVVAVNKADGETEKAAMRAASEYSGCLHLMPHRCVGHQRQPVLTYVNLFSILVGAGKGEVSSCIRGCL